MKTVAALLTLVALVSGLPAPAAAGSSTDAALALGAFAVLNQLVRGETVFHGTGWHGPVVRETVVVQQPPHVIYAPPPPPRVVYAPPPPPRVAYYAPAPGRWIWHGHRWVWQGPQAHARPYKHWKHTYGRN